MKIHRLGNDYSFQSGLEKKAPEALGEPNKEPNKEITEDAGNTLQEGREGELEGDVRPEAPETNIPVRRKKDKKKKK